MKIEKFLKGPMSDGRQVYAYTLENDLLKAEVIELGATLSKLEVKGPFGLRDIVLGFDQVAGYEADTASIGATVGRFANRIGEGSFSINDKTYELEKNNEAHHLHGGRHGAKHLLWSSEATDSGVTFSLVMKEEDDAYPGNLSVQVTYSLSGNELHMDYDYSCDEDSIANFTNHTYFNLSEEPTIYMHRLQLEAPYYTPFGEGQIPSGAIESVEDTIFDFREPKNMGEALCYNYDALSAYGYGYDHNFLMKKDASYGELLVNGTISIPGLAVQVLSDAPGFQLYTANYLLEPLGKNQNYYETHGGLCIEPQFVPNDINLEGFKASFIKKGQVYHRKILYRIIV